MAVNFEIPSIRVPVGKDGYFDVRGLNSEDVTFLTIHYLDDIRRAVAEYKSPESITRSAVAELVLQIAQKFPNMAVEIISRAADATTAEDIEKFRKLSFAVQIVALKHIAVLTSEDGVLPLGKYLGVVEKVLAASGYNPGPLMTSLQTIIGASGNQ